MWPFDRITVYTYAEEPDKEAKKVEENKAHNFWLYWHAHTAWVVHGPFSGYWGVAQATDSECQAVSLVMKDRKDPVWFKVADLVCLDR